MRHRLNNCIANTKFVCYNRSVMKVKVYAKLNLTLNILGVNNGYHNIDSVAVSADIFDVVTVEKRADGAVNVSGLPQVQTARNTAYRAACALIDAFGVSGADINIAKHIPLGAGLGGSSADAAAVIYCLCKLYGIDVYSARVRSVCASVGSDVNFMLMGGLGRLRGKGDDVKFYNFSTPLYFALTTFDKEVRSEKAYGDYDKLSSVPSVSDNRILIDLLTNGDVKTAIKAFNNNLQSAVANNTAYAESYLKFAALNGLYPNMTGSGSAYYVAYDNAKEAEQTAALLRANGYDTVVCRGVSNGIEEI